MHLTKMCQRHFITSADTSLKIGIVGGSLGGIFSGLSLQSLGFDVTIFGRGDSSNRSGAGYILTPPLLDYLQQFDIINRSNFDSILLKCVHTDIIAENEEIEVKEHNSEPRLQTTWDCLYHESLKKLDPNTIKFNKNMDTVDIDKMCINFDDKNII